MDSQRRIIEHDSDNASSRRCRRRTDVDVAEIPNENPCNNNDFTRPLLECPSGRFPLPTFVQNTAQDYFDYEFDVQNKCNLMSRRGSFDSNNPEYQNTIYDDLPQHDLRFELCLFCRQVWDNFLDTTSKDGEHHKE